MLISLGTSTKIILMSVKDILKSVSLCDSEKATDNKIGEILQQGLSYV